MSLSFKKSTSTGGITYLKPKDMEPGIVIDGALYVECKIAPQYENAKTHIFLTQEGEKVGISGTALLNKMLENSLNHAVNVKYEGTRDYKGKKSHNWSVEETEETFESAEYLSAVSGV